MNRYTLTFTLGSEGTFGVGRGYRGHDGATEIDPATGLPRMSADEIVGLLVEGTASVLRSLRTVAPGLFPGYEQAAMDLFGAPGWAGGQLRTAEFATVPPGVQAYVRSLLKQGTAMWAVREAVTADHSQTAVSHVTGVGDTATLRKSERVLRETPLSLRLSTPHNLDETSAHGQLLAAAAALVRRGGSGRRRGAGALSTLELNGRGTDGDLLRPAREAFIAAVCRAAGSTPKAS